ncbi:TPA: SH3 domain-containing protein [Clostridium perfringens]|nr:SH3 domain-containing protein [Clostridium perfringens]
MANNIIPNVNPGEIVGSTPTFPPNAVVKGDFLYLRDANGNQISGRTVSDGDEITVLDIGYSKQLVLVQYPTSSGYRQGYVSNATSIIKYKDDYSWVNGSTPEAVYDLDKTTQIGTLDPRERAVVLYKVDGMTAVAYDTGKGKLTKSGLVYYEGSGSSTGGGSFNGVAPGEVVTGGFTYDNNAQVVGDELYLRDRNGNIIPGRSVSDGDNITVLDVSYSKQLALVQYPAGKVVRQGYVTNATNLIRYFKQGEWLNGSTTEPVLDENGGSLGSLSPYEAATPIYKKNGMIHVVYDTSKGPNTKSGYVKFEGLAQLPDTSIQIPSVSHSQATVEVYGTSGKGRPLKVYKIGNGSKVLFAGFAIHGWEDRWDNDGLALVNIANSLISKIGDYKAQNGLHGWTVYIAPCMNPDGVIVRGTNNGPGRCAVKSRIDMNRCFPRGFKAQYNSRNYTGPNPLGAQEAVALKEFIEKINRTADELVVIDGHGWLGCTYGDSSIAQYFTKQFGFSHNGPSGGGYFSYWAQGLPRTRGLLLEYPDTYSYGEVISRNYIGKTFNAIINILKNNPNGGSVDSGNSGNGGSTSSEGSSSSADISYTATGEVINVQSFLNVRKGPGTNYDSIGQLHQGDKVSIVAKNGEWYKISSPIAGYVHSEFIEIYSENNSSNERIIDTTPDKLLKSITMNIEGVDIEFEWRLMPHDNKYHLMPVNELRNLEKYHHAFALQVSFGELVSFVLSLTPIDFAKDLVEFIAGKDIITGEKYDRVTLGACLLLPEFSEVLVKKGVKGAGPVARIFKASFKRAQPGIVEGAELLKSYEKISRGQGHIILIPKEVGIKLQGKKFKDFNEFRSEFWKEMSKSKYAKEFSKNNISNMSKGNAPIAVEEQWLGSRSRYELHHKKPIWDGGDVYNLDNLVIVSPRYHQEILDKDYHFQRGEFKID